MRKFIAACNAKDSSSIIDYNIVKYEFRNETVRKWLRCFLPEHFIDHIEVYRNDVKDYVILISPYDHVEGDPEYFSEIDQLYSPSATTFVYITSLGEIRNLLRTYKKKIKKINKKNDSTRTCKNCKTEKDKKMFPINYKKEDITYYRLICDDCYRKKRKEYHKSYNKKYYQKIKNNIDWTENVYD